MRLLLLRLIKNHFADGLFKRAKSDLPKTIYLPPETLAYEAYILDQPLPYILHLSGVWYRTFLYD